MESVARMHWAMACFDQEAGEEIGRLFSEPFDLLLGRKTYEILPALGYKITECVPCEKAVYSMART